MPTKWTFIETIRMKPLHLLNCKTELYRSSVLQLYGSYAAIWFSSMSGLILSKACVSHLRGLTPTMEQFLECLLSSECLSWHVRSQWEVE